MKVTRWTRWVEDREKNLYCVECGGLDSKVKFEPVPTMYAVSCPAGHLLMMETYYAAGHN